MTSTATQPDLSHFARIPLELVELPRWVLWRFEQRDGERTKVPYQPSGDKAKADDAATWCTYTTALETYADHPERFDGIGFVLGDGFAGVDLDNAIDQHGNLKAWAQPLAAAIASYGEISPSGRGIKFICRGKLPTDKTGIRRLRRGGEPKEAVELYQRARYFTLTGNVWNEQRQILDCTDALASIFDEVNAWNKSPKPAPKPSTSTADDRRIIDKVIGGSDAAKWSQLWSGDTSNYGGDDSAADLALCSRIAFFTGPDAARIASIFSQSGLIRDKWDRADYRERTISKALEGKTEFFKWNGDGKAASTSAPEWLPLTELGNAQRLAQQHADVVRWHAARGTWLNWNPPRWSEDATGAVVRHAKKLARSFWREAKHADDKTKAALVQHAMKSEKSSGIEAALKLLRSEPGIAVTPDLLDADPWRLNLLNGTLDLQSGELLPHDPAHLHTKLAPVTFDPAAQCPRWTNALNRIMDGNAGLVDYLARIFGLSLTGRITVQELFIFHGGGENGKNVVMDTVTGMLGDYAGPAPDGLLTVRSHDEHPCEIADLCGKRLVIASELEEGARLRESRVKRLTGDVWLKGRFMCRDYFSFARTHKLIIVANHRPLIRENTRAIWRRVRLVPFTVTIPKPEQDELLTEKLKSEWPGILNWALAGCLAWQRDGMNPPREVLAASAEYQAEQDVLSDFIATRCVRGFGCKVTRNELFILYQSWAQQTREPSPLDRTSLFERIRRLEGVTESQWRPVGSDIPARGFEGIGLLTNGVYSEPNYGTM